MKKLLAFILALGMVLALAACSGKDGQPASLSSASWEEIVIQSFRVLGVDISLRIGQFVQERMLRQGRPARQPLLRLLGGDYGRRQGYYSHLLWLGRR